MYVFNRLEFKVLKLADPFFLYANSKIYVVSLVNPTGFPPISDVIFWLVEERTDDSLLKICIKKRNNSFKDQETRELTNFNLKPSCMHIYWICYFEACRV